MRPATHRTFLVVVTGLLVLGASNFAQARPARPAPLLPAPSGTAVNVSTEPHLQAAMRAITSHVTLVPAPGTYRLTRSLAFPGPLRNVGIRGATGNSDDVVPVGPIRNNFFYLSSSQSGDVGIQVADSRDTQVVNNTVILSGTYHAAIEYRYPGTTGSSLPTTSSMRRSWREKVLPHA